MITRAAITASSYEGWVAWLNDGTPIFEAVPSLPKAVSVIRGGLRYAIRPTSRNTMDWKDVPFERIDCVEVYFDRAFRPNDQPVFHVERVEGAQLRFFQMKLGGIIANAGVGVVEADGLARIGIGGYRLGYYNEKLKFAEMWEVRRGVFEPKQFPIVGHPCWPRPHGYGLNPVVMGLTDEDVPAAPLTNGRQ